MIGSLVIYFRTGSFSIITFKLKLSNVSLKRLWCVTYMFSFMTNIMRLIDFGLEVESYYLKVYSARSEILRRTHENITSASRISITRKKFLIDQWQCEIARGRTNWHKIQPIKRCFAQRFQPITKEMPKIAPPLVQHPKSKDSSGLSMEESARFVSVV